MAPNTQYLNKLKRRNLELYNYFMRGMEIVNTLNSKMYEAYIVGGAVRDYILGEDFKDIDICTTATPREILEIFPSGNGRFSELGCVELKEENRVFQITTFREEQLVTSRKTKNIHYSKKLTDDILRRDFTINALALSSNYNVIDLLKAKSDLNKGIVKVIGKPRVRFQEDPLRILRGIELVARYNFTISKATQKGMMKCSKYLSDISEMKFSEALYKILNGKYAKSALFAMANMNLFKHDVIYQKWLNAICIKYKKTNVNEKLALLYYMYGSIPKNTCYSKETLSEINRLMNLVKIVEELPIDGVLLYKYGTKNIFSANQILATRGKYKDRAKLIKKIDAKMPIHDRRDFNFTTEELIQMLNGKTGPNISEIMNLLLNKVIRGEILNNNAMIRQEALRLINYENLQNSVNLNSQIRQPVQVTDIEQLKNEFFEDFEEAYAKYINTIPNYNQMTEQEKQQIKYDVKLKLKDEIIAKNAKYQILVERGII